MTQTLALTPKDAQLLAAIRSDVAEAERTLDLHLRTREYAIRGAAKRGGSLREIAEAVGISHQRVAQILGGD